jgi:nitrogen fixation/metabolism regulation signal transduction histidine kinase
VVHLKAVLDAMRAYTAAPRLAFVVEELADVVTEALGVVREGGAETLLPSAATGDGGSAELCRARIVQALTNVLVNAVESYDDIAQRQPVQVTLEPGNGWIAIVIEDFGCGMSDEVLADAIVLFTTSKPTGTGFGLPLAMKVVESEHGGRLKITSRKGRGTVVRMILPTRRPSETR